MGRHLKQRRRPTVAPAVVLGPLLVVGVSALVAGLALTTRDGSPATVAQSCPTALRVVAAASFAPVLSGVAPAWRRTGLRPARRRPWPTGGGRAGGAPAGPRLDPRRRGVDRAPGPLELAAAPAAGAGTVLALSPLLHGDRRGDRAAGHDGRRRLARSRDLVTGRVADPARGPSRCGTRPVPATGCWPPGRSARRSGSTPAWTPPRRPWPPPCRHPDGARHAPALPRTPGEVGLVPEHALLPASRGARPGEPAVHRRRRPHGRAALLLASDRPQPPSGPGRALDRVREALTGPRPTDRWRGRAAPHRRRCRRPGPGRGSARGHRPDARGARRAPRRPRLRHLVPRDRRSDVLVAVDVSGSMQARAPGSDRALSTWSRRGSRTGPRCCRTPRSWRLWEFGVQAAAPRRLPGAVLRGAPRPRAPASRHLGRQAAEARDTGHRPARHGPGRVHRGA